MRKHKENDKQNERRKLRDGLKRKRRNKAGSPNLSKSKVLENRVEFENIGKVFENKRTLRQHIRNDHQSLLEEIKEVDLVEEELDQNNKEAISEVETLEIEEFENIFKFFNSDVEFEFPAIKKKLKKDEVITPNRFECDISRSRFSTSQFSERVKVGKNLIPRIILFSVTNATKLLLPNLTSQTTNMFTKKNSISFVITAELSLNRRQSSANT